ncbi:hypothetical protein [Flaviaesturariibacter amylovorans]|uniref:BatC protein n=1 Tax=Flaviaesturariibacter amylovorans TaxID=1084520 RepID=A0ABP8HUS4_9BACT
MKEEQKHPAPPEQTQQGTTPDANAQGAAAPHAEEPHFGHGDRSDTDEMDALNSNDGNRANGFRDQ